MTLAELYAEVYLLTNRDDLVAQTAAAVRSATLKIHQLDYFYKDIFERSIVFPTDSYIQQLEYRPLFPRWRALKYLRKTTAQGFDDGVFFTVIPVPEFVEDSYKINQVDVCYVAGDLIQIRSSSKFQYLIVGCYRNPDITTGTYDSWVALDHPYAIIFEAAKSIFFQVGDSDQFAAYSRMAAEEQQLVRISNIQAQGY